LSIRPRGLLSPPICEAEYRVMLGVVPRMSPLAIGIAPAFFRMRGQLRVDRLSTDPREWPVV